MTSSQDNLVSQPDKPGRKQTQTEVWVRKTATRAERFLNGFLAALIAIYGIMTASVVYGAAKADGNANNNYFLATTYLTDSNYFATRGITQQYYDYGLYDEIQMHLLNDSNPAIIEYLKVQYSQYALDSFERAGGFFDDIYLEDLNYESDVALDVSTRSFQLALSWSQRSETFQVLATIMAVGLSFAAWASLMDSPGLVRWIFSFLSGFVLLGCSSFLIFMLLTSQPLSKNIEFSYDDSVFENTE